MARDSTIKVTGLKELEKNLLALQKEYGGKAAPQAMRPAVKAAIAPLKALVQGGTPVDEGWLLKSVKQTVGKPTRDMLTRSPNLYDSTTIISGRIGYFGNNVYGRALRMEYGTRHIPANHTLEQVFDREASGMLKRFKDTLGPAIEKKATALNKKRNKGG